MLGEREKPAGRARVDGSVRRVLGGYNAAGIEAAYNAGIPVHMPPIEGLSPNIRCETINLE